jgi:RimJ/RimL family protein N-acetyltransferase
VAGTELRTERLLLRQWKVADLKPFAEMNSDPEVMEFLQGPMERWKSDKMVDRISESFKWRGYGLWAVEVIDGPKFVGYVGLWDAFFDAPFTPAVEVGWRLTRDAWGHGYATEAAQAAVAFGFSKIGLPEIVSFTATENLRSRAVMERIGMTRDESGDFDHPLVPEDSPIRRHVLYRLSAESFAPA